MINNIQQITSLLKHYTKVDKSQIEEQGEDASADTGTSSSAPSGGGKGYPTVTKWESGVSRGPANQIGVTKWSDIVKLTRGKANPIDSKSKWDSGVKRGKGNTLI